MASYHVTIESSYWLNNYPNFLALPAPKRMELVRKDTKRIQDFLEAEPQDNAVALLVTMEDVRIVPLDTDVANGRVLRIK